MADVTPTGQERATILRRAVRVAVAASAGFYPLLYGAGLPVMALYALFAPIAVGLLPPSPPSRTGCSGTRSCPRRDSGPGGSSAT